MAGEKIVFVSGASSGFGKLTVPLLLEKGHTVVAGLRGGYPRLKTLFTEELSKYPDRLHAIELHLEKSASFEEIVHFIESKLQGRLDVLINNAGYGLLGVLEDQTEEQIRYQMEINFFGTALLTRKLLPMLRKNRGRILNVSSIAGLAGFPFYGTYSASKFAIEGLSESLHHDLKPFGVQVGLIEPGGFRTGFVDARQFGDAPQQSPYAKRTRAFVKAFEMTRSRLDDPMKVARLLTKLCDKRRVPLRNVIGKDACVVRLLQKFLPEYFQTRLIQAIFEFTLRRAALERKVP